MRKLIAKIIVGTIFTAQTISFGSFLVKAVLSEKTAFGTYTFAESAFYIILLISVVIAGLSVIALCNLMFYDFFLIDVSSFFSSGLALFLKYNRKLKIKLTLTLGVSLVFAILIALVGSYVEVR